MKASRSFDYVYNLVEIVSYNKHESEIVNILISSQLYNRDKNPIRTFGDYSKRSHEGYRNTIELPEENNVVPLRSDTILLVQKGCSFHGLQFEDPNQHLKDFLKLVDSLDLNGENRERTRLRLYQFSFRDQASNWLERLPTRSVSTWEDLTTRFLAQFFLSGRTAKLQNDILILGDLKQVNALVDQESDVNVMPLSTYMKLTDRKPTETDIRLSLASHSYIYPLRIVEDVLIEVVEHVYPVDFVILDIKEDEKSSFILGTPFITTSKAVIKFNKGTITLKSGKSKISFQRIPESPGKIERGVTNDIEPISPTMIVNRLVLKWEEIIKLHLKREM
nr:zinc finger, CCHC-type [Tanacetum cinerariifolium]